MEEWKSEEWIEKWEYKKNLISFPLYLVGRIENLFVWWKMKLYKFTIISLLNKKSNTFFIKKLCMEPIFFFFFEKKRENKPKEDGKKKKD